ncbi:MAG: hypothetical protein LBI06_03940 [Treponema sp.]|nr:hypothetical protein [Treponema sp.]
MPGRFGNRFVFEPGKYYRLDITDWAGMRPKEIGIMDETDLALHGIGQVYDIFSQAENKYRITRLSNGVGKLRAPNGKSNYNFGVHDLSANPSQFATI